MYVNDLTLDYGERGRAAVRRLLGEASEKGLIPPVDVVFAPDTAADVRETSRP